MNKPLTFLLSLTFLFLFLTGCFQAIKYAKENNTDQDWSRDYSECLFKAKGLEGKRLWSIVLHNCLIGKGYSTLDEQGNPVEYDPSSPDQQGKELIPSYSKGIQ